MSVEMNNLSCGSCGALWVMVLMRVVDAFHPSIGALAV
jgi:hypothetical protein